MSTLKKVDGKRRPLVSILLPAYNVDRYLGECLDSLWAQSFGDFEVIAVDDASSDATWDRLQAAARREARLRPIRNARNMGIAGALNVALARARGAYLARMDADDRAHPQRLALQIARMQADPALGVLGTSMRLWRDGLLTSAPAPSGHEVIKARMVFMNVMAHPTVMIRRSALGPLRYRNGYYATEDYELWTRLIFRTRFDNLPDALLDYRVHVSQSGLSRGLDQYEAATRVRWRYLRDLGFRANAGQRALHASLCPPFERRRAEELEAVRRWLFRLQDQNQQGQLVDPAALKAEARRRYATYCAGLGLKGMREYLVQGGKLRSWKGFDLRAIKAFLRCLIRSGNR